MYLLISVDPFYLQWVTKDRKASGVYCLNRTTGWLTCTSQYHGPLLLQILRGCMLGSEKFLKNLFLNRFISLGVLWFFRKHYLFHMSWALNASLSPQPFISRRLKRLYSKSILYKSIPHSSKRIFCMDNSQKFIQPWNLWSSILVVASQQIKLRG